MNVIFSTAELHPRDRFACWHEVACKTIVGHDSLPEHRLHFEAELSGTSLADIALLSFRNSAMEVARTRGHISRADNDDLFVCLQRSKKLLIEQGGREALLEPNNFCLLDPQLGYTARFENDSQILLLKVPREALEARIGKVHSLTAKPLGPASGVGKLTSAYIEALPARAGAIQDGADLVRGQVLDLIALSVAVSQRKAVGLSSHHELWLLKLRAVIEARLEDAALTPSAAAAGAGISVRYANTLLAARGTSLARLIRTLRLERCRKAIEDPAQRHRSLTDIAFGWGFSSQSHFTRAFAKAFGMSPSEYREENSIDGRSRSR